MSTRPSEAAAARSDRLRATHRTASTPYTPAALTNAATAPSS
ncbi:hypothetical protein [Streptomyces brevispora]|nr:hypothetical protein [Streptomyces brevispora]